MYNVLNCPNVAKHIKFYLGELQFKTTFTSNAGCFKLALPWYSKCYCVAIITKTFALDSLYAFKCKHFRNTSHSIILNTIIKLFFKRSVQT
jgi:hypothetical protein